MLELNTYNLKLNTFLTDRVYRSLPENSGGGKSGLRRAGRPVVNAGTRVRYRTGWKVPQKIYRRPALRGGKGEMVG